MISAREWTFVILNWRMNSERHSLNSESEGVSLMLGWQDMMVVLTNDRLEAIPPIEIQTTLTRQLHWIHDVHAHLDQALHHHLVFLKL
jgi:hypothetical protein